MGREAACPESEGGVMSAKDFITEAEQLCESDQAIADAPTMSAEELVKWLRAIVAMPVEQRLEESPEWIHAFVKGIRSGAFSLMDVM
jgi:hypothetical protein